MSGKLKFPKGFQYVQEPIGRGINGVPYLTHDTLVSALKERILHTSGGTFLITGFRGAGKTSLVKRSIEELAEEIEGSTVLINLDIVVARPTSTLELLFEIVRRLFEFLVENHLIDLLPQEIVDEITLAYMRTSLAYRQTITREQEGFFKLKAHASDFGIPANIGMSMGKSRRNSSVMEASFLAYSGYDVEHDLKRIMRLLNQKIYPGRNRKHKLAGLFRLKGKARSYNSFKLVVTLDELDKLTASENGKETLISLLSELKNILATRTIIFIFVGGVDLHDIWLEDKSRGDSVFESTFGWHLYVPCMWYGVECLFKEILKNQVQNDENLITENLKFYLQYMARGIPRRLWHEVNELVVWENKIPYLQLSSIKKDKRVLLYSTLERIVLKFFEDNEQLLDCYLPVEKDKKMLATYYIIDRIISKGKASFTLHDLLTIKPEFVLHETFKMTEEHIRALIGHLVKSNIIKDISRPIQEITMIGEMNRFELEEYTLTEEVIGLAYKEREQNRGEPVDLEQISGSLPRFFISSVKSTVLPVYTSQPIYLPQRYELLTLLGRGGMGEAYLVRDKLLNIKCVAKVLYRPNSDFPEHKARLVREAEVMSKAEHPIFVRFIQLIESPEGDLGIIREYAEGKTLQEILVAGPLNAYRAVEITKKICLGLSYLHEMGIVLRDIKPSNIIITESGEPKIIDLGLAKGEKFDAISVPNSAMIGTPAYMSPEQVNNDTIGLRSDLYSLGLLLLVMISGKLPWSEGDIWSIFREIRGGNLPIEQLDVSDKLKRVIKKATALNSGDRFASAGELLLALDKTPEGSD